ncbi:MAG: nucleoside monophosphate kinase [Patescibacteria group bacterium]|nr:nucleoside monophosphate kinase [bacterium]MDZ4241086.1 nucleoside monophosphate kinase [Patescibacteria group bacterium]
MQKSVRFILVTGGPCSGKNTLAEGLAREYGFGFIDMGDYLRKTIQNDPSFSNVLKEPHLQEALKTAMNSGHLLPDEIIDTCFQKEVTRIIRERNGDYAPKSIPIIVCGYPRTNGQRASFIRYWSHFGVTHLFLDGEKEIFLERLLRAGKTRGDRKDDSTSTFEKRWKEFKGKTVPMIKYLQLQEKNIIRNLRITQTNLSTIESVFKRARQLLALPRHTKNGKGRIRNFVGPVPASVSV